jgi:cytochrome b6-f complex iron-sulfur subunit
VNDEPEQLDRQVGVLLADRRPERVPLPDEDALHAWQTAAMLRAARPGVGLPSKEFLERMQRLITEWVGQASPPSPPTARPSRRALLLTGTAGIAAGVAGAVGLHRLAPPPAPGARMALVEHGSWQSVKALAELRESTPVAFRTGGIEGFLIRRGSQVSALSAICTHMGCILNYSKFRDRFECPCHGATFGTDGQPSHPYERRLPALPALQVRIQRGDVEVYSV